MDSIQLNKVKKALLSMQRHSWEQGVAMQAFWEAGDLEIASAMARETVYRSIKDGRTAIIGSAEAVTDPCSTGEVLKKVSERIGDKEMAEAHKKLLDWALYKAPRNEEGILYHMMEGCQIWVDSMYMLPPFLAASGHPEEAVRQLKGFWKRLWDCECGLMSHIWDDRRREFIRKEHWGVGNGWAMAGMARVIDLLPINMATEREELINLCTVLIKSAGGYIRNDGLAHDVLDNAQTFVETNFSQMLSYTIYKGIRSGWLDGEFKKKADICRIACEKKVDQLGFVRDVCGEPHFNSPGIAPEGQAFYIMMETAYDKLEGERHSNGIY